MLEILQFIFSDFWIWLGTVILAGVIFSNFRLFTIKLRDSKLDKYIESKNKNKNENNNT